MIARILFAIFMAFIITVMMVWVYGWALIATIFWNPGRLKAAHQSVDGFWKQYYPVWECLRYGVKAVI